MADEGWSQISRLAILRAGLTSALVNRISPAVLPRGVTGPTLSSAASGKGEGQLPHPPQEAGARGSSQLVIFSEALLICPIS